MGQKEAILEDFHDSKTRARFVRYYQKALNVTRSNLREEVNRESPNIELIEEYNLRLEQRYAEYGRILWQDKAYKAEQRARNQRILCQDKAYKAEQLAQVWKYRSLALLGILAVTACSGAIIAGNALGVF